MAKTILFSLFFAILLGPLPAYLESVEARECRATRTAKQRAYLLAKAELECRRDLAKSKREDVVLKLCKAPAMKIEYLKGEKDAGCDCY